MSDRYCPCCNMFKDVCLFDELEGGKLSKICMTCTEKRAKNRPVEVPRPINSPVREMHLVATDEFPGVDIDRIHHLRGAVRMRRKRR